MSFCDVYDRSVPTYKYLNNYTLPESDLSNPEGFWITKYKNMINPMEHQCVKDDDDIKFLKENIGLIECTNEIFSSDIFGRIQQWNPGIQKKKGRAS